MALPSILALITRDYILSDNISPELQEFIRL